MEKSRAGDQESTADPKVLWSLEWEGRGGQGLGYMAVEPVLRRRVQRAWEGVVGRGEASRGRCRRVSALRELPPCAHTGTAVGRVVAVLDRNLSLFSHIKMHAHNSALPLWPHISGNLSTGL